VEELQQKLNADGASPALDADGIFGRLTRAAVVAFQQKYSLMVDGIVGPETWGQMDTLNLASDVGRVEREWTEEVGGQIYGMTSRYTWRILADSMQITVKIKFTGVDSPEAIATSLASINSVWNRFTAVNTTTGNRYNIVFTLQPVESGQDNIVRLRPGDDRSDTENWYIDDPDLGNTAAHEFGHMIGLEDEYQRTHRDYQRLVGEAPPTGAEAGEGAATPAAVAEQMNNALLEEDQDTRVANARNVISTHSLEQGEYAQQIAVAYQTAYGVDIVDHIVAQIPDRDEFLIVDPFRYESTSIMGGNTDHDHPTEPRHLREFLGYLETARPGEYEVEER
jgi:lysozyme family protein